MSAPDPRYPPNRQPSPPTPSVPPTVDPMLPPSAQPSAPAVIDPMLPPTAQPASPPPPPTFPPTAQPVAPPPILPPAVQPVTPPPVSPPSLPLPFRVESEPPAPRPVGVLPSAEPPEKQAEPSWRDWLDVQKIIQSAPAWLVSAIAHMVLTILLAWFVLAPNKQKPVELEVWYAQEDGEQLLDDSFDAALEQTPDIIEPELIEDLAAVEDPLASPPELVDPFEQPSVQAVVEAAAPTRGNDLSGREEGSKQALLKKYGGTAETEAAVQRGLAWLVRQQDRKTGEWKLSGPYSDGVPGIDNELAATAMAMLALLGAGQTHQKGQYKKTVARGAEALLKRLSPDGEFRFEGPYNQRFYSQGQASIALCELYGMTKDPQFKEPAQNALDYAARIQSPALGGWRYHPRVDSDTSVTGWFMMALQSGMMSGLEVQSNTLEGVSRYLDSATIDQSNYYYQKAPEDAGGESQGDDVLGVGRRRESPRLARLLHKASSDIRVQ